MKQFIKYRPIQLVTFLGAFMLSLSACELDNGDEANFEEFGAVVKIVLYMECAVSRKISFGYCYPFTVIIFKRNVIILV